VGNVVQREMKALVGEVKSSVALTAAATALVWTAFLADVVTGGALLAYGVQPRTAAGLVGLITMPLLHGGLWHIVGNTIAGIPLALLSMERKRTDFLVVTAVTSVTAGLGAWLFGATGSVHVGASGVVFGLLGFLMARGFFERRVAPILLSLFVGTVWGGMLVSAIPGLFAGISWQAHLFGFLGGVGVARLLGKRLRQEGRSRG